MNLIGARFDNNTVIALYPTAPTISDKDCYWIFPDTPGLAKSENNPLGIWWWWSDCIVNELRKENPLNWDNFDNDIVLSAETAKTINRYSESFIKDTLLER